GPVLLSPLSRRRTFFPFGDFCSAAGQAMMVHNALASCCSPTKELLCGLHRFTLSMVLAAPFCARAIRPAPSVPPTWPHRLAAVYCCVGRLHRRRSTK